jgi:L-cysteate sulfo-lyase
MPNLTRQLGGPQLYIKRDDLTGLGLGGNKVRKLEFLLGEAVQQGSDTIITTGATQSNHVRQTAAACAKLGLKCVILLEERVEKMPDEYQTSGNVLLNRLLGAEILSYPTGTDIAEAMQGIAKDLRAKGVKPYIVPVGGSNGLGALGYCACALEILTQANEMNLRIDRVVVASGSGGTHDGLVTGFAAMNSEIEVLGISVSRPREQQEALVYGLVQETSQLLGLGSTIARDGVAVNSDYVGPAYGVPTNEMVEAVNLTASLEGILLDPVYTGKAMAGLIGLIRQGTFMKSENILFVHTGGTPALFAYRETFDRDQE